MMPDKIVRGSSLGCNDVLLYMKQINTRSGSKSRENLSGALSLTQTVSVCRHLSAKSGYNVEFLKCCYQIPCVTKMSRMVQTVTEYYCVQI